MSGAKRREPSRLMTAMANRVEETRSKLLTTNSTFAHSFEVDVSLIDPDPEQARKVFNEEAITSLAESLKAQGQLQPILLRHHPSKRGHWLIVAGERRWHAARQLGWPAMLAIEYTGEHEVAALVENLQRVDLNIVEEAKAIQRLIQINSWSQRTAAQAVGRSASDVNGLVRLLELPDDFLGCVLKSEHALPRNLLIELSRLSVGPLRDTLLARAGAGELTIQALRQALSGEPTTALEVGSAAEPVGPTKAPALGGKRRIDGKAIKRFHDAFNSLPIETFTDEDREALLRFARAVQEAFGKSETENPA